MARQWGSGGPRAGCPVRGDLAVGPARWWGVVKGGTGTSRGEGAWKRAERSVENEGRSTQPQNQGPLGGGDSLGARRGRRGPGPWGGADRCTGARTGSEGPWLGTGQRGGRWATMGGNRYRLFYSAFSGQSATRPETHHGTCPGPGALQGPAPPETRGQARRRPAGRCPAPGAHNREAPPRTDRSGCGAAAGAAVPERHRRRPGRWPSRTGRPPGPTPPRRAGPRSAGQGGGGRGRPASAPRGARHWRRAGRGAPEAGSARRRGARGVERTAPHRGAAIVPPPRSAPVRARERGSRGRRCSLPAGSDAPEADGGPAAPVPRGLGSPRKPRGRGRGPGRPCVRARHLPPPSGPGAGPRARSGCRVSLSGNSTSRSSGPTCPPGRGVTSHGCSYPQP